ncbi:hypothetical protein L7F22_030281 [Adiantum nelumboides]|nr:hypothetical protein [Adiantum nelumboides]
MAQIRTSPPEIVRPSIPSPGGVVELSVLDLVTPSAYTPHLLLFQGMPAPAEAYAWLKSSLAESLNTFYPLAGRLRDKNDNGEFEIVCSDEGALLQEAWIDCTLDSFCLKSDYRPELDLLAPQADASATSLVLVQMTHFECGSASLGFRMHHKTMDGVSMDHFLNWWATLSRAKADEGREGRSSSNGGSAMAMEAPPKGLSRSLLKPRKPPSPISEHPEYTLKQALLKHSDEVPKVEEAQDVTAKIFHFTPADIDKLKAAANRAAPSSGAGAYTRFEILAAHVWRGVTYARNFAPTQEVRLGLPVDGRQRLEPPLPQGFFGNATFYAVAVCNAGKLLASPLPFAADLVRAAIARVDDVFMRSALDWISIQDPGPQAVIPIFPDVAISSWTRLSLYKMDFGWGKPSHVRIPHAHNSMAFFYPSPMGPRHVEIYLGLDSKHMSRFENYASQALQK